MKNERMEEIDMADFIPVILGTDVNAYSIARSFHMAYGVKSLALGQGKLFMTNHSSIVDVRVLEGLTDPSLFSEKLIGVACELKTKANRLLLVASSDAYAELAILNKERLSEYYSMPFADPWLLPRLVNKKSFYELCDEQGLDYPSTSFIDRENYLSAENPFGYPVVLKASNSIKYFALEFEGKKKAFILRSEEELRKTLKNIYETTEYDDTMILQDFIPGDDSNMYVLNAYVGQDRKVRLMCLGHSLMEDPTPEFIGNYLAIVPADKEEVYEQYRRFLEKIAYTGFANFDMKYDVRDGKCKVFEINLRPGRSSFFTTMAGANLMVAYKEDAVDHKADDKMCLPSQRFLWLGATYDVIARYVTKPEYQSLLHELHTSGLSGNSLEYEKDMNFWRKRDLKIYYDRYEERFRTYFVDKNQI